MDLRNQLINAALVPQTLQHKLPSGSNNPTGFRPLRRRVRHGGPSGGFALLIVLWMLVLIALIVGYVTATGRSEIQIARNIAANAAASAAVEGAVNRAIFALADPLPDRRPPTDGSIQQIGIGHSIVDVRVFDENDWINPNLAAAALLEGLLRALNTPPQAAAAVADDITQWVGTAQKLRSADELATEYRAAGLDYAPPQTPLENLEELTRVRGVTEQTFTSMRPHLTLFGKREPNPATTDPVVAAAIRYAHQANATGIAGGPILSGVGQDARVVRILASAQGPGAAVARSTVIVRIGSSEPGGYAILSWQ
jgi:general secretion pathway protein K